MSLRETLENILSAPDPPNEETAKLQIVVPLLQKLGWSLSQQQIIFEYAVSGGRIDLALMAHDRVVAFIEAKAPRVDLSGHVEQVVKYAFHEGVDICVLTNGREWRFYLPMQRAPFRERRFATLRIREDTAAQLQADLESFLSRENIVSGAAHRQAEERWQQHREAEQLREAIPATWRQMLAKPDQELLDLVGRRVQEQTGVQPPRDMTEQALRPLLSVPSPRPATTTAHSPERPPRRPRGRRPTAASRSTPAQGLKDKPVGIRLWGEYRPVSSGIQVLVLVLEALHDRHGADDLERVLGHVVSRNPDRFSRPVRVGSTDIWINRSIKVHEAQRRSYAYLQDFGHPATDLEIL